MMGKKLTEDVFLILSPEYHRWDAASVVGMNVAGIRKTKPKLASGQVAVKVKLTIDSSLFEEFIPVIEAEIEGHDIILPTVEVLDNPDTDS